MVWFHAGDGDPTASDVAARPMPALGRTVDSPIRRLMVCMLSSALLSHEADNGPTVH